MPTLAPQEAARWLVITKQTLTALVKIHPLGGTASELPIRQLKENSSYRVLAHLVSAGILRKGSNHRYFANVDKAKEAIANKVLLSAAMWKKKEVPTLEVELPQNETAPSSHSLTAEEPATALEPLVPPPPIANLQKPPPGASHEIVMQWVFTLLHAQTENLIYMREAIDELKRSNNKNVENSDKAINILEKLL